MLQDLYKYDIEAMLKSELDEHLDQKKQQEPSEVNYRNAKNV